LDNPALDAPATNGGKGSPMKKINTSNAPGNLSDEEREANRKKHQAKADLMKDGRLNDSKRRITYFIVDYFGYEGRDHTFIRRKKLAELTGLSERTISRQLPEIELTGWIKTKFKGRYGRASEFWVKNLSPCMTPQRDNTCPTEQSDLSGTTGVSLQGDNRSPATAGQQVSPHPLPPRSDNEGVGRVPDAERSPADAARARAGEAAPVSDAFNRVSDAFNRVWAVWWFKPAGSLKLAKRAIADLLARDDAAVIEALGRCPDERVERLVAKAAAFAATRRRRWLHMWISEDEAWREDPAQPFAPKEERPTRPAAAAGKKKRPISKAANGAGLKAGSRVRHREDGREGEVQWDVEVDGLAAVVWKGTSTVAVHNVDQLIAL
jgi:hypothetical protein